MRRGGLRIDVSGNWKAELPERGHTLSQLVAEVVVIAATAGGKDLAPLYHCGGGSSGWVLWLLWEAEGSFTDAVTHS